MIEFLPEAIIQLHRHALGSAIGAVVVSVFLVYTLVYQLFIRPERVMRDITLLQITLLLYVGGYTLYASATTEAQLRFWVRICYSGVALVPLTFHLLTRTLLQTHARRRILPVAAYSGLTTGLLWLDRHWLITNQLNHPLPLDHPSLVKGPLFSWFVGWSLILIIIAFADMVNSIRRYPQLRSSLLPFAITLGVWIVNGIYDALVALGILRGIPHPWIGPVFAVLMIGIFYGQTMSSRTEALERRVVELDSLQVMAQALSASLDFDTILTAIYSQVARLMPAHVFYIALYNEETREMSFPLVVEEQQRVTWTPRRWRNGLTEYIIGHGKPLCLQHDFAAQLAALGLELIGAPAASWLGVPILAGNKTLGAMVVQSPTTPHLYDAFHEELLLTIAAQAGLVIQNAYLYARTDEALARRVQELDSILRAARDGIILLDRHWRVLAINRALTDYLGLTQTDWVNQYLADIVVSAEEHNLLQRVGYTLPQFHEDCQALEQGHDPFLTACIYKEGPPERYLERTLAPVRDQDGAPMGWLLVFHDITEQHNLARLREDMTHMLVHDLRSPMAVLRSSLELIQLDVEDGNYAGLPNILAMAHEGSERMLNMISQLLEINKLEEGKMPVRPELLETAEVVYEAAARIAPLAVAAHIDIETEITPNLPPLYADHELLLRVLHNLLDNAIKFSPDHSTIHLWAKRDGQTPPQLLLGVKDHGQGIPATAQEKLFKKFQQVVSKKGRRAGSGLGLPFCKLVIEAHGGQIWMESAPAAGSTFLIRLPLAAPPPDIDE